MHSKVSVSGFWYCDPCGQRVVIFGDTDSPARCPLCERRTAIYTATPAPPLNPDLNHNLNPHNAYAIGRTKTPAQWFAQMRALCGVCGVEEDDTGNPS